MAFRIGEPIFNERGLPGTVVGREPATANLIVDRDIKTTAESSRHGYIKGMTEDMRGRFNAVMDKIVDIKKPEEKVQELQKTIDEMEAAGPTADSIRLTHYLKAELFHVMNSFHVFPRTYKVSSQSSE